MSLIYKSVKTLQFPYILWRAIHSPTSEAIRWANCGTCIIIDFEMFAKIYFGSSGSTSSRVSSDESFLHRQLCKYGFELVMELDFRPPNRMPWDTTEKPKCLKMYKNTWFQEGKPELIRNIFHDLKLKAMRAALKLAIEESEQRKEILQQATRAALIQENEESEQRNEILQQAAEEAAEWHQTVENLLAEEDAAERADLQKEAEEDSALRQAAKNEAGEELDQQKAPAATALKERTDMELMQPSTSRYTFDITETVLTNASPCKEEGCMKGDDALRNSVEKVKTGRVEKKSKGISIALLSACLKRENSKMRAAAASEQSVQETMLNEVTSGGMEPEAEQSLNNIPEEHIGSTMTMRESPRFDVQNRNEAESNLAKETSPTKPFPRRRLNFD